MRSSSKMGLRPLFAACYPDVARWYVLQGSGTWRCSREFVLERGLREGCPSSPALFNIYHAAVMLDFRARRKEAAAAGLMDEGVEWIAQVDGDLFRTRALRRKGKSQLRTVLGDLFCCFFC